MMTWHTAAVMCEELYGVPVDMSEGYFVCPSCGEMVYDVDWEDHDDWSVCPICGDMFEEG